VTAVLVLQVDGGIVLILFFWGNFAAGSKSFFTSNSLPDCHHSRLGLGSEVRAGWIIPRVGFFVAGRGEAGGSLAGPCQDRSF